MEVFNPFILIKQKNTPNQPLFFLQVEEHNLCYQDRKGGDSDSRRGQLFLQTSALKARC